MTGREALAFRLCCLAIALYLLDDAFVHPEPGTGAGDHLAGGLVPTAMLAVLAVGGAARCAPAPPPRSRSPSGLSTVAVGDRRPGPPHRPPGAFGRRLDGAARARRGRRARRAGRTRSCGARGGSTRRTGDATCAARRSASPRSSSRSSSSCRSRSRSSRRTRRARTSRRSTSVARAEPVTLRTSDGLRLRGSYVPSRNGAAIIVFPGRGGDGGAGADARPSRLRRARARPPRRGRERRRLQQPRVRRRPRRARGGALPARAPRRRAAAASAGSGLSVGGELHDRGRGAVAGTCARSSPRAPACGPTASSSTLPGQRSLDDAPVLGRHERRDRGLRQRGDPARPHVASPPRIAPRPLFLIWATNGNAEELNAPYLAAAGEPKQGWEIPESAHIGGLAARPAEYERRVVEFFDAALGV